MEQKIVIKFSARTAAHQDPALWTCLFSNHHPEIGPYTFTFDPLARAYDWLVVYEDLLPLPNEKRSNRIERLACRKENTLFITTEPCSIKNYGRHYLRQFGHVLSTQPRKIIDHPKQIFKTPALRWFYGRPLDDNETDFLSIDTLSTMDNPSKFERVSTVCSNKVMTPTLNQRFEFTKALKTILGDTLEWYGRGVQPIRNKAEAMDACRYHIAIENHIEDHHWTEKIADCFLSFSLPFYYGPKNISDYFPEDSFIAIDIYDVQKSADIIQKALREKSYTARLPAILEARRRVLSEYNLMHFITEVLRRIEPSETSAKDNIANPIIYGRHAFRKRHPFLALLDILQEARFRAYANRRAHSGRF